MKELEISKELFNAVTNSKCHEVFVKNEFVIAHSNLGMKMVNIYEFVFIKCKEWANNLSPKRYQLYSGIAPKALGYSTCSIFSGAIEQTETKDSTEVEAIIKACEWILSEVNK